MHNKTIKMAIVFALVLTMLMPLGSMAANNDADTTTDDKTTVASTEDTKDSTTDDDEDEIKPITDEEAIALDTCEEVASNDKLILYADEDNDRICLYVKESGKYWWSSPINIESDDTPIEGSKDGGMKPAVRKQLASSLAIRVGDLRQEKRSESSPTYSNRARVKYKKDSKGLVVTYDYSRREDVAVKLVVHYELDDDNLYVYADSNDIEEVNPDPVEGKILTKILLCPSFAAVPAKDIDGNPTEGYMIVPDGSGAVINYNNGKTNYNTYSHKVYGRDYTTVTQTEPHINQQAYMPVLATVSGKSGVVAIATDGDANVTAKAQVSGQNKQAYNTCYFEFETRGSDSFFMSGEGSNEITVFEKNGKIKDKFKRFGIRYYPIDKDEDVNYADCAEVYRNYLIDEKGLTSKITDDKTNFYIDLFGGVMKTKSIIGVPVSLKTDITGYSEAAKIVDKLENKGVENIVANYNDWTNYSIKHKVSTEVNPSGTLGDDDEFFDFVNDKEIEVYPSMNNFTMDSSRLGYMTLTNTAIRISSAYSRQSKYSPAFGVALKGVSPALVDPATYPKIFDEMIESYKENDIKNIGFGDFAFKLVSDHSKSDPYSREKTMNTIVKGYKKAQKEVGSVIAESANAYVLPYVSHVTNVPVYSSGYNITDYDIPFYQMVIHGYVPYSTKAINASSDIDETFMLALAAGSGIHYDMTYKPASKLKDTDYDHLCYSNYKGWIEPAAEHYKASAEVLSDVAGMTISKYEISDDNNTITTTYTDGSKEVEIVIDKAAATATVDGKEISLADAMEGGK
ncbi:MAG: hypothetical protein IJU04_00195 [Ruminococcus sp.]|nr:hypothetical protein [Ruminococcus sp.]